ncbi:hypothetical protein ACFL14_00625 [Patescibacteria group bacterium]
MKNSLKVGLSFGLTSGVITTLGLLVGLNSSTHSKMVVLGGILVIAIADAMSDALGIHISEESDSQKSIREIWEATISTFLTKFLTALSFVIPLLIFDLDLAVVIDIVWGITILNLLSFYIAKERKIDPFKVILEHLFIAVAVIIATYLVGNWISEIF